MIGNARAQQMEGIIRESDLRRALEQFKSLSISLSQGYDIRKHKKQIIDAFQNGPHRNIRLAAFPLLKELPDVDYGSLIPTIAQDISSPDFELQLNAIKLLSYLPYNSNVEFLTQYSKEFNKMLIIPEFHYERLTVFSDILVKLYLQSRTNENEEDVSYTIFEIFTNISDLVSHSSRDIARNAIEVFIKIYYQYLNDDFELYTSDYFFEGNGSLSFLLKPLIIQLTNLFFPKLPTIISKISSFEIRTQVSLISFPISVIVAGLTLKSEFKEHNGKDLLAQMGTKSLVFELDGGKFAIEKLYTNILYDFIIKNTHFYSMEVDYVIPLFSAFFEMLNFAESDAGYFLLPEHSKNVVIKEAALDLLDLLGKVAYKKDLNPVLLNFLVAARNVHSSLKLFLVLRIFELTNRNVTNQTTKYFVYFSCLTMIIELSMELVQEKQRSAIFALFQQPWFIQKFSEQDENGGIRFKQEILICLIFSTFHVRKTVGDDKEKQAIFGQILVEVLDLAATIIEWKIDKLFTSVRDEQSYIFAFELYLVLLYDAIKSGLGKSVETNVAELIKRVNANELSHILKWKSLLMLSNHYDPNVLKQINFQELINELRDAIINKKFIEISKENFANSQTDSTYIEYWINKIESVISILVKFSAKFPDDKGLVVNLLSEYDEYLIKINNNSDSYQPLISCIMDYVEFCIKIVTQDEEHLIETTNISTNILDHLELCNEAEDVKLLRYRPSHELISIAYNVFQYKLKSNRKYFQEDLLQIGNIIGSIKPLFQETLGEESLNCQLQEEKLITGACDFVQVYASHATLPAHDLIAVQLRVCNITKFAIDKIVFRVYGDKCFNNLPDMLGKKERVLEEIPSNQSKTAYFTLQLSQALNTQISFEVKVEHADLEQEVTLKCLPYRLNILEFAIPDHCLTLNASLFKRYHKSLTFFNKCTCLVKASDEELSKKFTQKRVTVCVDYSKKDSCRWNHFGVIGYLWDQNIISLSFTRVSEQEIKNNTATLEIRANQLDLVINAKNNIQSILSYLFQGYIVYYN